MKGMGGGPMLYLCISLLAGACHEVEPCNQLVHDGDSFDVEVLGLIDPSLAPQGLDGLPSCNLDDVRIGARTHVQLDHSLGGDCYNFACPEDLLPSPDGLSSDSTGPSGGGLDVCVGDRALVNLSDSCTAGRYVSLDTYNTVKSIYDSPSPEGITAVRLFRALGTRGGNVDCSQPPPEYPGVSDASAGSGFFCADLWNLKVTKR